MKASNRRSLSGVLPVRRMLAAFAACCMLLLALTGCAKGEAGIDVHANGSADVTLDLSLPKEAERMAGGLFERLAKQLTERGFEASARSGGEGLFFQATRRYTREEFAERATGDGFTFDVTGLRLTYTRESRWLYDLHRLAGAFEPTELLSSDNALLERYNALPSLVRRLAENRVALDFKLSLPIPAVSHNATAKEGGTLIWRLSPTKDTDVAVTIAAPNIRTYVAVGIAILLLAGGTAWRIVAKRRRARAAAHHDKEE